MYDFIVIGSGSAGGILSRKLNLSGAKTLLLEAGKFYRKDTFPKTEMEFSANLFWGGGVEFDKHCKTGFLRSKAVGGTTITNQCLMDRFDALALDDWKQRSGVDFFSTEAMTPWYDKAESYLSLNTFENKDLNNNAKKFTTACDKFGFKWKYLRRGMSDCAIEKGNDCVGCLGGCFRDSKQSSLVTAIQPAEKEGLEIRAEFEVDKIDHKADHVVIYGKHKGVKTELKSKKVVLCGGSFGSTKMMLASGFKQKLPALGKGFCQHPQYMVFGLFDEIIDGYKGNFQTVASNDPGFRKRGFKLENVFAGPISVGMLFNEYGKDHHKLMKQYRSMTSIETAIRDQPEGGEMTLDRKGNLVITKILTDQDNSRRADGLGTIHQLLKEQGAKKIVDSPYYFGLHLMGGCQIGVEADKSVVNPEFNVHGHQNLYIADTSIYPSAPGINPSLTAMTLSNKLAEQLTS
ncbi:GMC family oxidoreductase N-terminal domain-containing protein [Bacteroidota bacterium]